MSYTKRTTRSLFGDDYVEFFKNGKLAAIRLNGQLAIVPKYTAPIELTRAQGFRYWKRHFPERTCYDLPALLEEATNAEPRSFGTFFTRDGEEVGYIG